MMRSKRGSNRSSRATADTTATLYTCTRASGNCRRSVSCGMTVVEVNSSPKTWEVAEIR